MGDLVVIENPILFSCHNYRLNRPALDTEIRDRMGCIIGLRQYTVTIEINDEIIAHGSQSAISHLPAPVFEVIEE